MADYEALTALIDFYGLKKEGKVAVVDKTPGLVVNKARVEGVMPILAHLATKADTILGTTNLERALVRQWVQFQFGCLDLNEKKELNLNFKKLNAALETSTYLAGERQTAADVLLYHGIHGVMSEMGYQDKERYVHLSRWFRAQQQEPKLRRGKTQLDFSRTRLY